MFIQLLILSRMALFYLHSTLQLKLMFALKIVI